MRQQRLAYEISREGLWIVGLCTKVERGII